MIYLDHNAQTPIRPGVANAMTHALACFGNPSSIHQNGRKARHCLEQARDTIACLLGVGATQLVFTSGATEALNGLIQTDPGPVLASLTEHEAVIQPVRNRSSRIGDVRMLDVLENGCVDLMQLEDALTQTARLKHSPMVCMMAVNNEVGTIQPMESIIALCQQYGARILCDASQAIGKLDARMSTWIQHLDQMVWSGHKFGAPAGIGGVVLKKDGVLSPWICGGGQEQSRRSGSVNLMGAIGAAVAMQHAIEHPNIPQWLAMRQHLESKLEQVGGCILGTQSERVANTTMVSMPGVPSMMQLMHLDLSGIAVSIGSACSSGSVNPSRVLQAMRVDPSMLHSAIRISLGWTTTLEEIDACIHAWHTLRSLNPSGV